MQQTAADSSSDDLTGAAVAAKSLVDLPLELLLPSYRIHDTCLREEAGDLPLQKPESRKLV